MTDPIREAESTVGALRSLEQYAIETGMGTITINVREGRITSALVTRVIPPDVLDAAGPLATLVAEHMYGGIEFDVRDGRIVGWTALPRRRIA